MEISSSNPFSISYPPGGSIGGSRIVTPDVPFSVEDLTSDYIFYVQDSQHKTQAKQDIFSFYISDGHSQTEAFNVEIDIQVTGVCVPSCLKSWSLLRNHLLNCKKWCQTCGSS